MNNDLKLIGRRFVNEVMNQGRTGLVDELVADDYQEHDPFPGQSPDREGLKEAVTLMRQAFPDLRATVELEIAEKDLLTLRLRAQGTHRGEFMGIPPTQREATWTETHIVRFRDGAAVEHWADFDQLGLLQQLGVIPSPQEMAQS